jgi:hypothetical protein
MFNIETNPDQAAIFKLWNLSEYGHLARGLNTGRMPMLPLQPVQDACMLGGLE